jgi:hypothetical protein
MIDSDDPARLRAVVEDELAAVGAGRG